MARYIAEQEEHHRKRSFSEEVRILVRRHELKWHEEDETVGNGFTDAFPAHTPRSGVLMRVDELERRIEFRVLPDRGPENTEAGGDSVAVSR